MSLQSKLNTYAKVRKALDKLEKQRRQLETELVDALEYGEDPIYTEDCRIMKVKRIKWIYPQTVVQTRRAFEDTIKDLKGKIKDIESKARKSNRAKSEDVYGINCTIGKTRAEKQGGK